MLYGPYRYELYLNQSCRVLLLLRRDKRDVNSIRRTIIILSLRSNDST